MSDEKLPRNPPRRPWKVIERTALVIFALAAAAAVYLSRSSSRTLHAFPTACDGLSPGAALPNARNREASHQARPQLRMSSPDLLTAVLLSEHRRPLHLSTVADRPRPPPNAP